MAKGKATVFFCQDCGYESSKWMGQCPGCGGWNTFVEEVIDKSAPAKVRKEAAKAEVVKIADIADSSLIIEKGVREFLDTYKDTVYADGLTAKLGIYCGTIEKLEETVYPQVSRIVAEYGLGTDVILKFHKGNKQYKMSADSQMLFDILDKSISKIRIVLLVQIGKEGWDCRSLTGIILSQEGDCPTNMVLQTSCRCLRQVIKNGQELVKARDFQNLMGRTARAGIYTEGSIIITDCKIYDNFLNW